MGPVSKRATEPEERRLRKGHGAAADDQLEGITVVVAGAISLQPHTIGPTQSTSRLSQHRVQPELNAKSARTRPDVIVARGRHPHIIVRAIEIEARRDPSERVVRATSQNSR